MLGVTYLIILLPLVGFAIQVLWGRRLGDPAAGAVATFFIAASFVVAVGVYLDLLTVHAPVRTYTQNLWTWIPVGGLQVHASLFVDPLSMTMVLFVTGVSALIHLYSIGYMKGTWDYPKFFLYMNLFVASMLILVLGATCWSPSSGGRAWAPAPTGWSRSGSPATRRRQRGRRPSSTTGSATSGSSSPSSSPSRRCTHSSTRRSSPTSARSARPTSPPSACCCWSA
jgi:hypothetical protein